MYCSLPGSSIHGIFQARVLEWVAISFSRGSSRPRDWTQVSCIAGRHFTIWATSTLHSLLVSLPMYWSPHGECVYFTTAVISCNLRLSIIVAHLEMKFLPLSSSYQQFMPLTCSLSFEHLNSPGYLLLPQSTGLLGIWNSCFLFTFVKLLLVYSCFTVLC